MEQTKTGTSNLHEVMAEADSGADFEESMRDSAETSGNVSQDRATRFYDRIRRSIAEYLEKRGAVGEKAADFLLLVPDIFILLWRLTNDPRVNAKNKVLLGSGLAYYIFPLDFMPEGFLGPIGYLDDLVFAVYMLNRMLAEVDVEVLREHWSGDDDVLSAIQRVLQAADGLVGSDFLTRVKKMMK